MTHDGRVTAARPDLASAALEGLVRADRHVDPRPMRVRVPVAPLRTTASAEAEQADQLLFGETFDALDEEGDFAWGQARRDGYVGFVERACLGREDSAPTHWVRAPRTFAFARASIKAPAAGPVSLNALVTVTDEAEGLMYAQGLGWVAAAHLLPVGRTLEDAAGAGEGLVGTPYLWGGRDSLGLDCSGLVQQCLYACGRACPRDADQQAELGASIARDDLARGDLVCWRGHIGLMLDAERLLHANAHHMAVAIEPLAEALARIGAPIAFRRP